MTSQYTSKLKLKYKEEAVKEAEQDEFGDEGFWIIPCEDCKHFGCCKHYQECSGDIQTGNGLKFFQERQ